MNYENVRELKINEKISLSVKTKNNVCNIEVKLNVENYDTSFEKIEQIIHQINSDSVFGFFELYEKQLFFKKISREKINEITLTRWVNSSIASIISLSRMLEVVINE